MQFDRLAGTCLTSHDPQDIIRAAENGRIETYDLATGTWTIRAPVPGAVGTGGALATDGTYIYALRGKPSLLAATRARNSGFPSM